MHPGFGRRSLRGNIITLNQFLSIQYMLRWDWMSASITRSELLKHRSPRRILFEIRRGSWNDGDVNAPTHGDGSISGCLYDEKGLHVSEDSSGRGCIERAYVLKGVPRRDNEDNAHNHVGMSNSAGTCETVCGHVQKAGAVCRLPMPSRILKSLAAR